MTDRILIVEDENDVAMAIQDALKLLGYEVAGTVDTGEEAICKVEETDPDLVLMDIKLAGKMDGIEAADQIHFRFGTPVVYLTAHSDEQTLRRAKVTEPFGYITKPFSKKELSVTIQMALYKHKMEKKLKENVQWLKVTLRSIGAGVIATNKNGFVTLMNPTAEKLTGWSKEEGSGRYLPEVFNCGRSSEITILSSIRERKTTHLNEFLTGKDGKEIPIEGKIAPIKDDGDVIGTIIVFYDITERLRKEEELYKSEQKYRTTFEYTGTAMAVIEEDMTLSLVNEEFEKLSGYSKEEIEGNLSWIMFAHPEDLQKLEDYHRKRWRGDKVPNKYESRFISKDGQIKNVLISIEMIPHTKKAVCSIMDITSLRRLNKLLKVITDINELVTKDLRPEEILISVCKSLNSIYPGVFSAQGDKLEEMELVRAVGIDVNSIYSIIEEGYASPKVTNGEVMKVNLEDNNDSKKNNEKNAKRCLISVPKYQYSLPLVHNNKLYGLIGLYSNLDFTEEERKALQKLSTNLAFALCVCNTEENRGVVIKEIAEKCISINASLAKLKEPIEVIQNALETSSYESLKIVKENLKTIQGQTNKIENDLERVKKERTINE